MKKQKLNSKLSLKKITINKLDSDQYLNIVGGNGSDLCNITNGTTCQSGNAHCIQTKGGCDISRNNQVCIVPKVSL